MENLQSTVKSENKTARSSMVLKFTKIKNYVRIIMEMQITQKYFKIQYRKMAYLIVNHKTDV